MITLPIIKAVFCPWTNQLHDIGMCHQLCDWCGSINDNELMCSYEGDD